MVNEGIPNVELNNNTIPNTIRLDEVSRRMNSFIEIIHIKSPCVWALV
jgi:hypothetical protein